jgi:hypothetical protein
MVQLQMSVAKAVESLRALHDIMSILTFIVALTVIRVKMIVKIAL